MSNFPRSEDLAHPACHLGDLPFYTDREKLKLCRFSMYFVG